MVRSWLLCPGGRAEIVGGPGIALDAGRLDGRRTWIAERPHIADLRSGAKRCDRRTMNAELPTPRRNRDGSDAGQPSARLAAPEPGGPALPASELPSSRRARRSPGSAT